MNEELIIKYKHEAPRKPKRKLSDAFFNSGTEYQEDRLRDMIFNFVEGSGSFLSLDDLSEGLTWEVVVDCYCGDFGIKLDDEKYVYNSVKQLYNKNPHHFTNYLLEIILSTRNLPDISV